MIVKFDHISYVCGRLQKTNLIAEKGQPVFSEINLHNLTIKKALMAKRQSAHDLFFYDDDLPTEYIFYDEVNEKSNICIKDNKIYGLYSDKEQAMDFLRGIFGNRVKDHDGEIICNMRGILDKRDYIMILQKTDDGCPAFLDDSGYGIPALIVKPAFSKIPEDGVCTETEKIVVNGRNLKICFTKSDSTNIIFELITVVS